VTSIFLANSKSKKEGVPQNQTTEGIEIIFPHKFL